MPSPRVQLPPTAHDWDALRAELGVPAAFPPDVEAEARGARPRLQHRDLTEVAFLTLDPPGSVDLDQAMALERRGAGYRIRYAIADVAAFVVPGRAVDREAHRRGLTLYAPDRRTPLHPPVLSEGAASLLAGQARPALVWDLVLDADGVLLSAHVERATVRSCEQLDYPTVQRQLDGGTACPELLLLREIGVLRHARARERDAVDLPTPEQLVSPEGALSFRAPLPCEEWNAQISLLTGMAAAGMMLAGGIGVLRTLPDPDPDEVASLRRSALALGVVWPEGASHGDVLSSLDPSRPAAAALLTLATRLLRGAGYTSFDGALPARRTHSGVAAPYAHCTAPLRRLADRYAGEVCLALAAGRDVPDWARGALPALPQEMALADQRSRALDRAVVDLAEAYVLQHRVGETFRAVVVEANGRGGTVQLLEPAVRAMLEGTDVPLGEAVDVVLDSVDVSRRSVRFRLA